MFYKMIENKCTQWYESERCTVKSIIEYIEKAGQMRDAQIEAIKVYLFLKIACECKPLTQLFRQGFFNSIDLNEIELSKSTREYLFQNPAAAALFEYACLTNDKGEQVSEKLEKQIKKEPAGIDYNEFFRNAFYGVSYTDYLFSLPTGTVFSADPGRKSVSTVIQLCRLYGGGKRNWRYGTCSSRKYQFRTFSDHWFRNWADRRIGNLYFSVFWKWQL